MVGHAGHHACNSPASSWQTTSVPCLSVHQPSCSYSLIPQQRSQMHPPLHRLRCDLTVTRSGGLRPVSPPQSSRHHQPQCLHHRQRTSASARRGSIQCLNAVGALQQLTDALRRPFARSKVPKQRDELLELVAESAPDGARVAELVEQLAASKQPFDETLLGGGPWQAVYTAGPLAWQRITGNITPPRNSQASIEFIPEGRKLINRGYPWGAEVSASGTYEVIDPDATSTLPLRIKALVSSGALRAFGREIPLPIKGSDEVELLYLDRDVRVLRSPQFSIVVQLRPTPLAKQKFDFSNL